MSRIEKEHGEEHNFYQSYTDLMMGLIAVLIVACSVMSVKLFDANTTKELALRINNFANLVQCIKEKSEYFEYHKEFERIELKKTISFPSWKSTIQYKDQVMLEAAGEELYDIINRYANENLSFKITIEGRSANASEKDLTYIEKGTDEYEEAAVLSYRRAKALYSLWHEIGGIKRLERKGKVEFFIAGSGLEGKYRYEDDEEWRNKTCVIHIIPYISPDICTETKK